MARRAARKPGNVPPERVVKFYSTPLGQFQLSKMLTRVDKARGPRITIDLNKKPIKPVVFRQRRRAT